MTYCLGILLPSGLILASDSLETDVSVSHNLTIHLRDNLMFVHLDGKMLFDGRIILRGESHPGLIGARVWDSLVGVASTEIISTRIAGRRDAVVAFGKAVIVGNFRDDVTGEGEDGTGEGAVIGEIDGGDLPRVIREANEDGRLAGFVGVGDRAEFGDEVFGEKLFDHG